MSTEFNGQTWRPVGRLGDELEAQSPARGSSVATYGILLVCSLAVVWYFVSGRELWTEYQEKMHRLEMRRRHGIPDTDLRPFAVAYRDVSMLRAREEAQRIAREDEENRRAKEREEARRQAALEKENIKPAPRPPRAPSRANDQYSWGDAFTESASPHVHFSPTVQIPQPEISVAPIQDLPAVSPTFAPPGALPFLDVPMSPPPPISAREPQFSDFVPLNKGKKRSASSSEEEQPSNGHRKIKKLKNLNGTEDSTPNEPEGADDANEVSSERSAAVSGDNESTTTEMSTRGVKRNHETESQIGEPNGDSLKREHQKRRLEPRRPESTNIRGKKRDRSDVGSVLGDSEVDLRQSRKRGKLQDPDISMEEIDESEETEYMDETEDTTELSDDQASSEDPLCQGRRIGEEWEANGQKYKVGATGVRLRHTLVKQWRKKFNMPKDSVHPDARQTVQVIVEAWLTEEEFKAARDRQELAWQTGTVNPQNGSLRTPLRKSMSSTPEGKRLFWSPFTTPDKEDMDSPARVSTPNPFSDAPRPPNGRASLTRSVSSAPGSYAGSPRQHLRSFSKWEKQELEAAALARLRRTKEEKAAEEERAKAEKERLAAAPAITVTAPAPTADATKKDAEKPSLFQPMANYPDPNPTTSFAAPPLPVADTLKTSKPPVPQFFAIAGKASSTQKEAQPLPQEPPAKPSVPTPSGVPNFFSLPPIRASNPLPAPVPAPAPEVKASPPIFQTPTKKSLSEAPPLGQPSLPFGNIEKRAQPFPSYVSPQAPAAADLGNPFAAPKSSGPAPIPSQPPIFGAKLGDSGPTKPSIFSSVFSKPDAASETAPETTSGEKGKETSTPTPIFGSSVKPMFGGTPTRTGEAASSSPFAPPPSGSKSIFGSALGPEAPSPFSAPKAAESTGNSQPLFGGVGGSKGFSFGTSFVGANSSKPMFGQPPEAPKPVVSATTPPPEKQGDATTEEPSKAPPATLNLAGGVFGRTMRGLPKAASHPPTAPAEVASDTGKPASEKPQFSFSFATTSTPTPAAPSPLNFGVKPLDGPSETPTSFSFASTSNPFAPKPAEKKD